MLIPILTVEAMLKTAGILPVNVKFIFEGQEEIGSPNMPDFVRRNADLLRADRRHEARREIASHTQTCPRENG
jgi:acetylornithine deacetylase/succinyl-diaminopimelate desuccinylase-like protein